MTFLTFNQIQYKGRKWDSLSHLKTAPILLLWCQLSILSHDIQIKLHPQLNNFSKGLNESYLHRTAVHHAPCAGIKCAPLTTSFLLL